MTTGWKHYILKYCGYFYDCYTCVKTAVWVESYFRSPSSGTSSWAESAYLHLF